MSSNLFSKSIDVSKYGMIFASAQKNFGPAGVTLVIIREDLIDHVQKITPSMCNYNLFAKNNSLYNTPPCFSIYLCGLYFEYMIEKGGINFFENESKKKSKLIYEIIDNSKQFYHALVGKDWRSRMNIPFRIHDKGIK